MKAIYEPTGQAAEYSHLALNLYRGCHHGCYYCYAPGILRMAAEKFDEAQPRREVLKTLLYTNAPRYRRTDMRVLLSFTSDPYQPLELGYEYTRAALQILGRFDIPFQILTKAGALPMRDFDLYGPHDAFAVTLTSLLLSDQEAWEPRAAPPSERLAALIAAHEEGIETWVSLEPVIDPEKSLQIIKETRDYVDLYKIGTLNHRASDITPEQWGQFGRTAVNMLTAYDKRYYVKQSLQKYLGDFPFENTDTRTIER